MKKERDAAVLLWRFMRTMQSGMAALHCAWTQTREPETFIKGLVTKKSELLKAILTIPNVRLVCLEKTEINL